MDLCHMYYLHTVDFCVWIRIKTASVNVTYASYYKVCVLLRNVPPIAEHASYYEIQ